VLGFKQGRVTRENLKQQAIDLIRDTYDLSVQTDEADALCIAMAHLKNMEEK
jgi:Holliday junction resolvasome RuvABC endonuclease subunit